MKPRPKHVLTKQEARALYEEHDATCHLPPRSNRMIQTTMVDRELCLITYDCLGCPWSTPPFYDTFYDR